jgi:NADH:ubiquinone oxidoreductase subunit E
MEVYKYLEISTNIYLKYYPEKKQEVLTILEKIQEKYLSDD